jgi:hypothetical protein
MTPLFLSKEEFTMLLSALRDRWLTDFIKATIGKDPDFSEEHWVDSWKKFWGPELPKDGLVRRRLHRTVPSHEE